MSLGQIPNGEQQFIDGNGRPYALGFVYSYIPNTLTFKNTWQDPGGAALNTNPIHLDAAGRAVIWGTGFYRQVLRDANGSLVWDKIVSAGGSGGGLGPLVVVNLTFSDSPYTVQGVDQLILCDCSGGDIQLNMYAADSQQVSPLTVQKTDATINIVTITAFAGNTINGESDEVLFQQDDSVDLDSDNASEWRIA